MSCQKGREGEKRLRNGYKVNIKHLYKTRINPITPFGMVFKIQRETGEGNEKWRHRLQKDSYIKQASCAQNISK